MTDRGLIDGGAPEPQRSLSLSLDPATAKALWIETDPGQSEVETRFLAMTEQPRDQHEEAPAREASAAGRLVFISHDTRDADLAEAFSKLLSSVSAGMLKTFRSSDRKGSQGIAYGVEWYPELMSQLDNACDVVCLLTARSVDRPWLLYEAGVAKGKLDIPVHGLALGLPLSQVSTGPFAQFQNCDDDEASLAKLVEQLVRRLPHADPDHDTVVSQVALFNERVGAILEREDSAEAAPESASEDASAKLFEEIKVMFQDLPGRIEAVAARPPRRGKYRESIHPGMLREMAMMGPRGRVNAGVGAMILTAPFRDELPWLYTIAEELFRASNAQDGAATRGAIEALTSATEAVVHGPLPKILELSRRDIHMALRELPVLLDMWQIDSGAFPSDGPEAAPTSD